MGLRQYNTKRDFSRTPEPAGRAARSPQGDFFCVQKHDATRLHYDFRLELDGVLLSWAVTRGPSPNPADKRLAVRTEDHPLDYGTFEGTIPKGEYGGGTVMLWDVGTWTPLENPRAGLKKGKLKFALHGQRLRGEWSLVRMKGKPDEKRENWLLVKDRDDAARKHAKFLDKFMTSVKTGRTMDQIADPAPSPAMHAKAQGLGALVKKYPGVQLATLVDAAPAGPEWIHEVKFDGYRLLGYVSAGKVRLHTRNGHDWTSRFPHICKALAALPVRDAVVDMEAVIIDDDGRTNFQKLQNILGGDIPAQPIHAYLFDCLHLDGRDLRALPLLDRKKKLKPLLPARGVLHYSDHHRGDGDDVIALACKLGTEGIISKRADAPYAAVRNRDWLKVKCVKRQEFIILGYTDSTTGGHVVGALHLGYYKGRKLHYAGKVGTGFTAASAREIYKTLAALPAVPAPDVVPRTARRASHWVKPVQLCEVTFGMWTDEGRIRHASFHALRSDKPAREVTMEKPLHVAAKKPAPARKTAASAASDDPVRGVTITHPDRVVFEPLGVTKGELAAYYGAAAPAILHDIAGHPVTLLRCPEGAEHECFYQRNLMPGMGAGITPFRWKHKGKSHTYFYTDTPEGVVRMIQMGAIELHTWGARADKIDFPDRIIFDCDPGPDVPFEAVKLAARDLRKRLDRLGLESFVKCTGGKGLHVRVPIAPVTPWEDAKTFARNLCEQMERDVPEAYVTTMTKSKRAGKIFLDFFRNDYTATAVADYAVRARDGAPVAVPLEWSELGKLKSSSQFTMKDALRRLAKKQDLRRYTLKQRLTRPILNAVKADG